MRLNYGHKYLAKPRKIQSVALFMLLLIAVTGVCAAWIASSQPLYIKDQKRGYFPAFSNKNFIEVTINTGEQKKVYLQTEDWYNLDVKKKVFAPIPYDPGKSDLENAGLTPPLSRTKCKTSNGQIETCNMPFRHWLGTNNKGEDLLSGLIHGAGISLKIGFFSILISLIIGLILGVFSGYYGNDQIRISPISMILFVLGIVPFIFYSQLILEILPGTFFGSGLVSIIITVLMLLVFLLGSIGLGNKLSTVLGLSKRIFLPVDSIINRGIEVFSSIPRFMILVGLAVVLERNTNNLIIIIGITSWAGIARLVRGEIFKIRSQGYFHSARALGLSPFKIVTKHMLPNISGILIVSFVFGMSGAILMESGLSFLNIGVPEGVVTWGQLMADGRKNFNAWWMILFPGLAVMITVTCLNLIGEQFRATTLNRKTSLQL